MMVEGQWSFDSWTGKRKTFNELPVGNFPTEIQLSTAFSNYSHMKLIACLTFQNYSSK